MEHGYFQGTVAHNKMSQILSVNSSMCLTNISTHVTLTCLRSRTLPLSQNAPTQFLSANLHPLPHTITDLISIIKWRRVRGLSEQVPGKTGGAERKAFLQKTGPSGWFLQRNERPGERTWRVPAYLCGWLHFVWIGSLCNLSLFINSGHHQSSWGCVWGGGGVSFVKRAN